SACTICLGHHAHNVANCTSKKLWNNRTAYCHQNKRGHLVSPSGNVLCTNWQGPNGCTETTHDLKHECS
ncbi:hypothetical protein BDQ12DRAFT_588887, partial [Crucibulum laeve]